MVVLFCFIPSRFFVIVAIHIESWSVRGVFFGWFFIDVWLSSMKHLPFYNNNRNSHRIRKLEPADSRICWWRCKNRHINKDTGAHTSSVVTSKAIFNYDSWAWARSKMFNTFRYKISAHVCCVCRAYSLYGINMNASLRYMHEFQACVCAYVTARSRVYDVRVSVSVRNNNWLQCKKATSSM